jgi:hypothetical protein
VSPNEIGALNKIRTPLFKGCSNIDLKNTIYFGRAAVIRRLIDDIANDVNGSVVGTSDNSYD